MGQNKAAVDRLKALGFSKIEALVYCFLLRDSPATGYRIAQGVGKAAANVYAAIETLTQKGALLIDDSERKLCRAVGPGELIDNLEKKARDGFRQAEAALSAMEAATPDQRVYKLETAEQTFARVKRMIGEAKDYVLADAFPSPLRKIAADLAQAASRNVTVALETYDAPPPQLSKTLSVRSDYDAVKNESWPGQQLNIVVDAREHVLAQFDSSGKRVLQAIWSTSGYLSCLMHSYMAASMLAQQAKSEGLHNRGLLRKFDALALTKARPIGLEQYVSQYLRPASGDENEAA